MLLVVSFLLRLFVGLVGLRVHTPHALSPLPINNSVLLFTGQRKDKRQEEEEEEETGEEWEKEGQDEEKGRRGK